MLIATNDVGELPTLADLKVNLTTSKALAEFAESNFTESLDGQYNVVALNLGGPDAPLRTPTVAATNDGPTPSYRIAYDEAVERLKSAANENVKPTPREPYHLKELYEKVQLGNFQPENELHWHNAERLRLDLKKASGEPVNEVDWRDLMLPFYEGINGDHLTSTTPDEGLSLNEDGEFEDTSTLAEGNVVDNGDWNAYRDLPPKIDCLYATQVIALAHDVLGRDFELLRAFIQSNWTTEIAGRTEGYKDRAAASACGKGMLRAALRNLSRFYCRLDRLEERGDRPTDIWPLIGRLNLKPVVYPPEADRFRRASYWNQARGPVIKVTEAKVAA